MSIEHGEGDRVIAAYLADLRSAKTRKYRSYKPAAAVCGRSGSKVVVGNHQGMAKPGRGAVLRRDV